MAIPPTIEIHPAHKVLHGNPVHEFYILEVKNDSALLMRTNSETYNNGAFHQKHEDGQDKPFYPTWVPLKELYVSTEGRTYNVKNFQP